MILIWKPTIKIWKLFFTIFIFWFYVNTENRKQKTIPNRSLISRLYIYTSNVIKN